MIIESTATTRKKTRERQRAKYLLPRELRDNADSLITFLKDYYTFMNTSGEASAELSSIDRYRDVDQTIDTYLDALQAEMALSFQTHS